MGKEISKDFKVIIMTKKKTIPVCLPVGNRGFCEAVIARGRYKGYACSNKARYETSSGKFCYVHAIKNLS